MPVRSAFRGLREVDSFFVRNYGATSYRELLAAMRVDPLYSRTQYVTLQKRAGRMWQAEKKYRAQQRAARTHVGPVASQWRGGGSYVAPASTTSWDSWSWPAAHAGCCLQ